MKSAIKVVILFFWVAKLCFGEGESVLTRVNLDQATRQVSSLSNDTVLGAITETIDSKEVHIIKVLDSDGWIRFYKIDAETGALIS
jgi:hypothetical protein